MGLKQLNNTMEQALTLDSNPPVDTEVIDEYKKLNEKCDIIILRIKKRKSKSTRSK